MSDASAGADSMPRELRADLYDYSMSDTFVSETRQVPYRTGFRTRQYRGRLPIKKANELNDHDLRRYNQNGCRFPDPEQDLRDEIAQARESAYIVQQQIQAQQEAIRVLQQQVQRLSSLLSVRPGQTSAEAPTAGGTKPYSVRGLDVTKRA